MKKTLYIFTCIYTSFLLSCAVFAENVTKEDVSAQLAEILVSTLYFIGALALIYLILTLVSKWGKKHPDEEKNNSEDGSGSKENSEDKAEESAPQKNVKENSNE